MAVGRKNAHPESRVPEGSLSGDYRIAARFGNLRLDLNVVHVFGCPCDSTKRGNLAVEPTALV
jgi:hypothetical protein